MKCARGLGFLPPLRSLPVFAGFCLEGTLLNLSVECLCAQVFWAKAPQR